MKKITFLLMAFLIAIVANAEPANPKPVGVTQPDGSTLQLKLAGDEFYHFNTTIDGYTIINVKGTWEYAVKGRGGLVASGVMAHDPAARDAHEMQMVASLEKRLVDKAATTQARLNRATRDEKIRENREPTVDYGLFRGLIVLINFNDRQFLMEDPNDFYSQLCNTSNYTGFYHNGQFQRCTGSVRDYYYDNSMGQFDPEFDIAGPVNLDYSCLEGNDKARDIFKAALDSIDAQVDFTKYDADNDGEIDMVFFLVAGYASSYSGNNSGYLWPHMSYLIDWWSGWPPQPYIYDGKRMGTYASSCEIYGWESQGATMPNAIGTICHEFSHVLGLPDLYDTDYSSSGGESNHPGDWDVMAGGSYANFGRTPVGYSLWERVELGFTDTPEELSLGSKILEALNESNMGYMMQSPNEYEFFLFENRQPNKWDAALPGHGLVITRVDYSNEEVWWSNEVNCDPAHNYYELIRSSGPGSGEVPFPGSRNVTYINSSSYPELITWTGESCPLGLSNIREDNKIITFNIVKDMPPLTMIEDFEQMQTGLPTNAESVQGNFATWNFTKADVVDYNGSHAVSMQLPASLFMNSDVDMQAIKITLNAINTSGSASKLQLFYSTDEGETWTSVGTESVPANSEEVLCWHLNLEKQPIRFKVNRISGAKNVKLIIDDITLYYLGEEAVTGDVNGDGKVNVSDVTALVNMILGVIPKDEERADVNGDGKVNVSDVTALINLILGIH